MFAKVRSGNLSYNHLAYTTGRGANRNDLISPILQAFHRLQLCMRVALLFPFSLAL